MMKNKNWLLILLLFAGVLAGCKEDPIPEPDPIENKEDKEEAPELIQKINSFIQTTMNDVYLWYREVPDIDIRYELDPEKYFKKLLYEEDKWSYITDDVEALENSFEGREKSFGYSLAFGTFENTGDYFALVEFVYPNTPASEAGLKRGDIIVLINNSDITADNYRDLLRGNELNITLGVETEDGITTGSSVSVTAKDLDLNPLLIADVVEHEGHKIGYLFYAQYISKYNSSLDSAFQYFSEEQITDLVVDLRYNPGGVSSAAQYLCSSLAPLDVVNSKSTLVTFQWNDKYQRYWEQQNFKDQIEITFVDTTAVKLGLDKIYILTGPGTASASELSITGLIPYMSVTTVGNTTYGKYTASITVKPEIYYDDESYYSDFDNWGIQPIVIRYANSLGVTDFKNGFTPDIQVKDDLFAGIPLGDKTEPLLKAAIEDITGIPVVAMKKAREELPHTLFDRGFSKYDPNKREMIFDNINKKKLKK